jgi:hypothetical protein
MDEIAIYLKRYGAENEHIVKLVGLEIAHSVGALPVMKDAYVFICVVHLYIMPSLCMFKL